MKKILILILMILLISLPAVFAQKTTTIKDGWIPYYTSFSSGGVNYSIHSINAHNADPKDALIAIRKNGNVASLIKFGQCDITPEHEYCFVNRSFDNNLIDIDSKGNLQPALKVKLLEFSYSDDLKISRTFSKTSLHLNENTEVEINIENTGDYPISNIVVNEPIPKNFKLVSFDEHLLKEGDSLKGTFNLYPGKKWSAKYVLQAISYNTSEKYSTLVEYLPENEKETKTKSSSAQTISVIYPYNLQAKISSSKININGKVTYTLTLTNKENEAIYAKNIEITVPSNIDRVFRSELSKKNSFTYSNKESKIDVGKSQTFKVEGYMDYAGTYEFSYSGEINVKGHSYTFSGSQNLEVVTKGISCSILTNDSNIDSGETYEYSVLINNNDYKTFYEIQGESNKGDKVYVENMFKKTKKEVIKETDKAKVYFEKTANNISFNGKYRTVNNQWFNLSCEKSFNVNPVQRIVYLHLSTNDTSFNRGQTVSVMPILENLVDANINNIVISNSLNTKTINLSKNTNLTLSPFVITIPEKYNQSTFNTTINVEIPSKNYNDSFVLKLAVNNPYISKIVSTKNEENDSLTQQNNNKKSSSDNDVLISKKEKDTSKMGFFEKLKYLLKSIFGSN